MLNDFFESFCLLDWHSQPDGMGGVVWDVTDGVEFPAGLVTDQSAQARIAYQQGAKVLYTLVFAKSMKLEAGDGVKRLSDGLMLRITSNARDMQTPDMAAMQYAQVSAEVLAL